MKDYDPQSYWDKRAPSYRPHKAIGSEFDLIANYVKENQPQSILEVGAGTGRIYNYLRGHGALGTDCAYTMVDFSVPMMDRCFESTGIRPDRWDGETLPYADKSYDLVLSVNVALHVPEHDILAFLSEHLRVGKSIYLVSYWSGYKKEEIAPHVFEHDYNDLLSELGAKVLMKTTIGKDIKRRHWVIKPA